MAADDPKRRIAERAARELRDGEFVNLGIGLPTMIPDFLGETRRLPALGERHHRRRAAAGAGRLDPDLIDASKRPVTELPGVAFFDSADSFAMIRGGHVDVAVLGALQVAEPATWRTGPCPART